MVDVDERIRRGKPHPDLSLMSMDDETQEATLAGDEDSYDSLYGDNGHPERIGRYLVLDELGAGAMGVVYAAYDPDLDRKLALKLLHDDDPSSDRTLRLLREAQALARVSHQNVIQVYDVGTFDERVYIAMEFIDGLVLGDWLEASPRTPAEVLQTFLEAGRGLAAAHEKGLVHRDFKPDNVIVARDGRVVVLDFGIAHAVAKVDEHDDAGDSMIRSRIIEHSQTHSIVVERASRRASAQLPSEASSETSDNSSGRALDHELTRVGALIGTPAYMSPEQLEGRETDERSDQFSFCVALWQAIHGERPYTADSPLALWQAMQNGKIAPPSKARIPARTQRALRRGLSVEPDERFEDMASLLAALDRDPVVTGRRIITALAIGAAIVIGGISQSGTQPEPVCQGAAEHLEGVWDEGRRAALTEVYTRSSLPLAQQVLPSLLTRLDAYAETWVAMHTDACEATHVRGEQSAELLDLRMRCLDERARGLDTLVDVLLEPNATVIQNSYAAVSELRPLASCADQAALVARVAPPDDPELTGTLAEIDHDIAEARALRHAGTVERARARAKAAKDRAVTTHYAPIEALALIELGKNMIDGGDHEDAHTTLREGFYRALAAGDDEAAVDAATSLVKLTGDRLQTFEAAENWTKIADAILTRNDDRDLEARVELQYLFGLALWRDEQLERARSELEQTLELAAGLGDDQDLLALRVRKALGTTLWSLGKPELAAEQLEIVADRLADALGPTHPRVASALNNLASAHFSLGKLDQAESEFSHALGIIQDSLGETHPSLATGLNNLAVVHTKRGRLDQARDMHLRALALHEANLDPNDVKFASSWINLARVHWALHDYEAAADYYARAHARCLAELGEEHSDTLTALAGLGLTHIQLGRRDEGLEHYERVRAIRVRVLGPDHPDLASLSHDYGMLLVERGELERGTTMLRDTLSARERILAADHPDLASTIAGLAHARVLADDPREARALLERFSAIEPAARPSELTRAQARLDLANLVGDDEPEQAKKLAREGLEFLAHVEGPDARAMRHRLERML